MLPFDAASEGMPESTPSEGLIDLETYLQPPESDREILEKVAVDRSSTPDQDILDAAITLIAKADANTLDAIGQAIYAEQNRRIATGELF